MAAEQVSQVLERSRPDVGGLIVTLQLDDMIVQIRFNQRFAAQQSDGSFTKCDIAADLARAGLNAEGGIHRIAKGGEVAL